MLPPNLLGAGAPVYACALPLPPGIPAEEPNFSTQLTIPGRVDRIICLINPLVLTPDPPQNNPDPSQSDEMAPAQGANKLFIKDYILTRGVHPQEQSPIFNLSMDVFSIVISEIMDKENKDITLIDRIMFSLTCKSAARLMAIQKSKLPRPLTPNNLVDGLKRQRLNFMLRLAPWFEDLSTKRDKPLLIRELDSKLPLEEIIIVREGFRFCVSCLKYRPAEIFMKQVESGTWPTTVRWTRCLPGTSAVYADPITLTPEISNRLREINEEPIWTKIEVDKKKLPLYEAAPRIPKSTTAKAKPAGSASSSRGKKGKAAATTTTKSTTTTTTPISIPRKKTSAPLNEAEADQRAEAEAAAAREQQRIEKEIVRMQNATGMEDCVYLPVDASGQMRIAEMGICEQHVVDPLRLIGL